MGAVVNCRELMTLCRCVTLRSGGACRLKGCWSKQCQHAESGPAAIQELEGPWHDSSCSRAPSGAAAAISRVAVNTVSLVLRVQEACTNAVDRVITTLDMVGVDTQHANVVA
jgi:hypothetical protein